MEEYKVRDITFRVERDEFGPEAVYEVFNPRTQEIKGWLVIDNTAGSPLDIGKGGTAMYPDLTLDITLRKARTMTFKQVFCVPIGEKSPYKPWGGAKGGIVHNSSAPDAPEVLKAWAKALGTFEFAPGKFIIPDKYIFGLDVGLKEWASRAVVEVFGGNPKVATGKPKDLGGIPYDELGITGYGLVEALKIMSPYQNIDFENSTLAIQGFGAVGAGLAKHLLNLKRWPKVVAISDWGGAIYNPDGIDLRQVIKDCQEKGSVVYYQLAEKIELGKELFLPVDILVLAYKEDQITEENVAGIKAKIIGQGANLGITLAAEKILHQRGVWTLPDFVVNCGASIIVYVEYAGGTLKDGLSLVKRVIRTNAKLVIEESIRQRKTPREIAQRIAEEEVRKAMKEREDLHRLHRFYDRGCLE